MGESNEEFVRRSGYRFNLLIRSLPSEESSAIPLETLLTKAKGIGYRETPQQLAVDVSALMRRKEIASAQVNGKTLHWKLPKGQFEVRKRELLIKLHAKELTEDDLETLEKIVQKPK